MNPSFSEDTFTGIIGMIFIGTMIGSPLGGLISDKLQSRKKAMIGGGVLSLIVMLIIIFPPSSSAGLFYILFLLLGIIVYHLLMLPGEAVASEKGIGSFIPIIVIVLLAMANKGIIKDEKLVKSVDRLR